MGSRPCRCGGSIERQVVPRYDLAGYAGFPAAAAEVPVLVCRRCRRQAIRGRVVGALLLELTRQVLASTRLLAPAEIAYLRRGLGIEISVLAERLGVPAAEVLAWEEGSAEVPPALDYCLRGVCLLEFFAAHPRVAAEVLGYVRQRGIPQEFLLQPLISLQAAARQLEVSVRCVVGLVERDKLVLVGRYIPQAEVRLYQDLVRMMGQVLLRPELVGRSFG